MTSNKRTVNSVTEAKVLVVDDHDLTRNMVRAILRGVGFEDITQAESGDEALARLRSHQFDLVICDWNMPEGSGIEVLQIIRREEKNKNIPFVMLTAEVYRENIVTAMGAGVTDYVAKPFTSDVLIAKIRTVMKKHYNLVLA